MYRFIIFSVTVFVLNGLITSCPADDDPSRGELRTYTVSCKLVRKLLVSNAEGKTVLETVASNIPDITTLEGTRGEYHSGGKAGSTPYGFLLRVRVNGAAKSKVRLEVKAEDSSADSVGLRPVIQTRRQQVVRHIQLGKQIKLELDRNDRGEGIWVELSVQEAKDD